MVLLISFKGDHVNGTRVIEGLPFSGLIPCLRPHAVLTIDTVKPTFCRGGTLLPARIQISLRGRWTNTMWKYDVIPGGKFYEHNAERHYEIGYLLQRWAFKHQKKTCISTGFIGRLIVLIYSIIHLFDFFNVISG